MRKLWDTLPGEGALTRSPLSFRTTTLYLSLFILSFFILVGACANLGSPDGGPYDETPPRVISALPANQATNADKKKINILFDEYIKIENASEKVVVSPPQTEMANVRADGKRIKIVKILGIRTRERNPQT